MDWQPIETAPRDGTEFLATHTRLKFVRPYICSWGRCKLQPDGYVANSGKEWWRAYGQTKLAPRPTHWMPLPEPPQDNQEVE